VSQGKRRNWSFEETSMAFVLYLLMPMSELDDTCAQVQKLASALGRTPSSVALKICNIAAHDENRLREGKAGMSHGSHYDAEVWERYGAEGDEYLDKAIVWLLEATEPVVQGSLDVKDPTVPEGKERWTITAQRVNQQYFRNTLLANYRGSCCITGIDCEPLLVASHIKPWRTSDPVRERLSPANGILLNALHDRAFDQGLITIDKAYRVHVSKIVPHDEANDRWLWCYEGEHISEPISGVPSPDFIEYHNDMIFKAG
jgi:putative restriction endonuclease